MSQLKPTKTVYTVSDYLDWQRNGIQIKTDISYTFHRYILYYRMCYAVTDLNGFREEQNEIFKRNEILNHIS